MAQYVSLATDWWRVSSSTWISPTNRVRLSICSRHRILVKEMARGNLNSSVYSQCHGPIEYSVVGSVYQEVYHSVMNLPYYLRHTLLK